MSVPSRAAAQAKRRVLVPSFSSQALRVIPWASAASSASMAEFSSTGSTSWSTIRPSSSVASYGLPRVADQSA